MVFRICEGFLYSDPIFWSLECPLYTGLNVFSYDNDINIIYLYLHHLYIKKQYVWNYVYLGKSTSPRCIIHIGEDIHENIKLFSENMNNWEFTDIFRIKWWVSWRML